MGQVTSLIDLSTWTLSLGLRGFHGLTDGYVGIEVGKAIRNAVIGRRSMAASMFAG